MRRRPRGSGCRRTDALGGFEVTAARLGSWVSAAALAALLGVACGGGETEGAAEGKAAQGEAAPAWTVEATPSPGAAVKPQSEAVPQPVSRELPADFPEDVPQYPGAEIVGVRSAAGQGVSVSLTTADDVEKVASHFADGFAAQGWATDIKRMPEGKAIFAEKDNRTCSAIVRSGDTGTLVDLIVIVR
jgi:hypothetical protein